MEANTWEGHSVKTGIQNETKAMLLGSSPSLVWAVSLGGGCCAAAAFWPPKYETLQGCKGRYPHCYPAEWGKKMEPGLLQTFALVGSGEIRE